MRFIFQQLASASPSLKFKLRQAGMVIKPEDFLRRTVFSALYMTIGVSFIIFLPLYRLDLIKGIVFALPFIIFFTFVFYLYHLPDVVIRRKEKDVSREIVFAGRFLIVELESGVPLYNAIGNLSKNFRVIGHYALEITNKVELGTSLEDALNEEAELNPSNDFRRIIWQILNSLRTGSDVAKSLSNVIDQITREQAIDIGKYGKKLNPLAMFYMIIAVVLPSLGITMLIILSSFMKFHLNLGIMLILAGLIGFMQFMFIAVVRFSRPPIDF